MCIVIQVSFIRQLHTVAELSKKLALTLFTTGIPLTTRRFEGGFVLTSSLAYIHFTLA